MHPLILLAKRAVEVYIKENKIISSPSDFPKNFLERQSGVFVTIEKMGELRGCIGTYLPTRKNIVEETIYNAVAAATEDYRFGPIKKEELPFLSYTVYLINKPQLVKDLKELNPKKYGIIVKAAPIDYAAGSDVFFDGHLPFKTGLLLPDLEGVDSVEKQIYIACQKGGINLKKEKIAIYRFTVEKFKD